MTLYSIIVLALFAGLWLIFSLELGMKNSLIRKLKNEKKEVMEDYNQIVKDYNDVVDFLEKHFTDEELRELFLEHDLEKFTNETPDLSEPVLENLRESLLEDVEKRF